MIEVDRGAEPPELAPVRTRELARLRDLVRTQGRDPLSTEIDGYKEPTRRALWEAQHHKCCYCEHRVELTFNDVEHYRSKARADRLPGSLETHGYWWLAFTWENLLFACPQCNRSGKNDQFPLAKGSRVLRAERAPPGQERPLILDPTGPHNPVEHIVFEFRARMGPRKRWYALPREGSQLGHWSIEVYDLNRDGALEVRADHVRDHVDPHVVELNEAMDLGDPGAVARAMVRAMGMLKPRNEFVALSYDAFRLKVPADRLARFGQRWPKPAEVARR